MSIPLHKKISEDLLQKIKSGVYAENELIPTEHELVDMYGVSRPTIRHALQSLVNQGYLEKRKKRGTVVTKPKFQQEFTHVIESFDSEMSRKGIAPKTKILNFKVTAASEEVAENLQIKKGDKVYKLIRLRYAEDKPVVLVTSYIPYKPFPNFLAIDFTKEKLYKALEEAGHPVITVSRKLEVIKADETTSDLLDVDIDEPLFYFHTQGFTNERRPVEYSISKYRGDLNYFVFELSQ